MERLSSLKPLLRRGENPLPFRRLSAIENLRSLAGIPVTEAQPFDPAGLFLDPVSVSSASFQSKFLLRIKPSDPPCPKHPLNR
jgi:hypothetical protein